MKNIFVEIEERKEGTSVIWIAKVLLVITLKGLADRSEIGYAFLQFMDCTRPLNGIDNGPGCMCLR